MKLFLFQIAIIAAVFTSCQKPPSGDLTLKEGESAKMGNVILTFNKVLEDSRCPKYVNCVWEGRAIVEVDVQVGKRMTETKKIIIGGTKPEESKSKVLFQQEGYSIEVVGLDPYPEEGAEPKPYELKIKEVKS